MMHLIAYTFVMQYFTGCLITLHLMIRCDNSQSVHIDGVGALDTETHPRGIFDRRIDWRGQKWSKMTGSRRATDLIEHFGHFSAILRFFMLFRASKPYLHMLDQRHMVFYIISNIICETNT